MKKFFLTHKTKNLKRQISHFSGNEMKNSMHAGRDISLNSCPHHGSDTWLLVNYFYDGISPTMRKLLETMYEGDFMSKKLEEALEVEELEMRKLHEV